ncbi:MAG: phosphoribosyltransferase family protein, partial [Bacteroidota bacterium]
ETSDALTKEEKDKIIKKEQQEIQRRIRILRKGKALPEMKSKIIILVDDGIATGATLFTAIAMCKKKQPSKLVVAAPIASQQMEFELRKLVDDVLILEKPTSFYAVGQGYRHFENLSDEETMAFVDAWELRLKNAS